MKMRQEALCLLLRQNLQRNTSFVLTKIAGCCVKKALISSAFGTFEHFTEIPVGKFKANIVTGFRTVSIGANGVLLEW
jgi:hypothetical protein